MDGQAPRKDIAQESSPRSGIQHRWWHELSSLASESEYRELRQKYQDREAADAKAIEDCVRGILSSKYYQIDSTHMHRIVQLKCQFMSNVSYAEKMKVTPELTSDHNGCGSNISDPCGKPYDQSFQADQESLILDYIYSSSYDHVPKRYLTNFAVKRDFFHSFCGFKEDDLDQKAHATILRDELAKNEEIDDAMRDSDCQTSNEGINASIDNRDDEDIQLADHHLLT